MAMSYSDVLRSSVAKQSGVGGSRSIGGRLAQSATGLRGMKRWAAAGRNGTRAAAMGTSGAEHGRTCAAVTRIVRL